MTPCGILPGLLSRYRRVHSRRSPGRARPITLTCRTHLRVVIACPEREARRTLRGTEPEIAAPAEMWQEGHQRAVHAGGKDPAAPKHGEDLQLPGIK